MICEGVGIEILGVSKEVNLERFSPIKYEVARGFSLA